MLIKAQQIVLWLRASNGRTLIGLSVAFLFSFILFSSLYWRDHTQLAYVENQLQLLEAEYQSALTTLAKADVESSINRNADYHLRKTLETQQATLDEQARMLEFYNLLMARGDTKSGLALNSYNLAALDKNHLTYDFQFVFVQYAKSHKTLKADISITLLGQLNNQPQQLLLNDIRVKNNKTVKGVEKLNFKYFQKLEGQLTLPSGFVVKSIIINAKIKHKKAKPWQRIIDWEAEE